MTNQVTIHVQAKDHASKDVDRIGRTVEGKAKRSFGRIGMSGGLAFAAGFIKTITFGQIGSGFALAATKMAPQAAKAGGLLGGVLAVGLLTQLTTALSAGLPLLLGGALLAGPLMHLWKTQTEAVDRLKVRAKDFIEFISQPLEIPFQKSLEAIGDGLERIGKPLRRMLDGLGPSLEPLTKGVMKGIENFVLAIEPAMPAVAAGMQAWADAAPRIGKAMGDFLAKIMQDPEATVQAVEDITDSLIKLADNAGNIISSLQDFSSGFNDLNRTFVETRNKHEAVLDGLRERVISIVSNMASRAISAGRRMASGLRSTVASMASAVASRIRSMGARARDAVADMASDVAARARNMASRVASAASNMAARVVGFFRSMAARGRSTVSSFASSVAAGFRNMISRAVSTVSSGAARVVGLFRSLGARIRGVFAGAGSWLVGAGRALINGLISGIRAAAGAAAAVARNVIQSAVAAARAAIPGFAHGGYVGASAAGGGPRGGTVLVGEQGPELVTLPFGSQVHSNADSKRMGGDGHITLILDLGKGIKERLEIHDRDIYRAVSMGRSGY